MQKRSWIVHVLDDLHRADDIEPLWLLHERLGRRMTKRQRGEAGVCCCVARRDADILR